MRNKANIKLFLYLLMVGISLLPSVTLADIGLDLKEGIKFFDENDKNKWFKINTHFKFDQTNATRDVSPRGLPHTSNHLRNAELSIKGGLGDDFSYLTRIDFTLNQKILDAYLKYSGFGKRTSVLLGQIPVPYGFENASSAKWSSFLEKSLPTGAFASLYGVGVYLSHAFETVTASFALTQHSQGYAQSRHYNTDPLQQAIRFTFSPVHTPSEVYHLGVSARHYAVKPTTLIFTARPEARGPLSNVLLKTPRIRAKNAYVVGSEVAYLRGPFTFQGEYMAAYIQRLDGPPRNVRFHGWYGQASYILTGESRDYDFKMGTFGRIRPHSPFGAWEIAFRHSYISLSNRNLRGGRQANTAVAIGWTMNSYVRILGNYIRAVMKEPSDRKRKVDIIGIRLQWVY